MEKVGFQQQLHLLKPSTYNDKTYTAADLHNTFSQSLKDAINKVNKRQIESDVATTKFINGQITNLHDVMIAAQKASVTRTAAVEVRNKVIDAYKEIMRMPM